jgi:hypothetical protein
MQSAREVVGEALVGPGDLAVEGRAALLGQPRGRRFVELHLGQTTMARAGDVGPQRSCMDGFR